MNFIDQMVKIMGPDRVAQSEPMSVHTTFRIGGPADLFVVPADAKALAEGIALCRACEKDYFILGNGSNLLVGDGGYRGVVFNICKTMDEVIYEEDENGLTVTAGAGIMLSKLARTVSSMGYTGFEYATGIPGTLGGGVTMNAGAYGGEIKDNILWAEVLDTEGCIRRLLASELSLSYRHSLMMEQEMTVLKASFRFEKGDEAVINAKVAELSESRRTKQPLEYPSAGSTFKRPEGYFAGKLIQDCGMKGYRVGDAMVSDKHAGFVVNVGSATAKDVMDLIRDVQKKVKETFGVEMETEVRMLGDF